MCMTSLRLRVMSQHILHLGLGKINVPKSVFCFCFYLLYDNFLKHFQYPKPSFNPKLFCWHRVSMHSSYIFLSLSVSYFKAQSCHRQFIVCPLRLYACKEQFPCCLLVFLRISSTQCWSIIQILSIAFFLFPLSYVQPK